MKFNELTKVAKAVAVNDYMNGWKETHPDEELSIKEATELCIDTNEDVNYNHKGVLVSTLDVKVGDIVEINSPLTKRWCRGTFEVKEIITEHAFSTGGTIFTNEEITKIISRGKNDN